MEILIAEYEPKTILELENMLIKLGHQVSCVVSTGAEAVKKTAQLNPDLVIVNLNLKGKITGVDAGKKIRNNYNIPVIFITIFTKNCLTKSLQLPEDAVTISKPVKQEHLEYCISMAFSS